MKSLEPTSVDPDGMTSFIDRLGKDCTPDQYIREFVQNSIEAILRTKEPGEIVIDKNDLFFDESGVYKLSITDNGDGMAPEEMRRLLNKLSATGHKNEFENYGLGAKISAMSRNRAGILYESWKSGVGHHCLIHFDQRTQQYGMKGFEQGGYVDFVAMRDDDLKPDIVAEHGTRVTLFGDSDRCDTMDKPEGVKGSRDSWLELYLNSRYFRFPEVVTMKVRTKYYDDDNRHSYLATVKGQLATLERFKRCNGTVRLADAAVHWWILEENRQGHSREYILGHTAALHNNEILDKADGRSSRAALFGIVLGASNVVLYVEPSRLYSQKTSRTSLTRDDGNPLPWEEWADEFRKMMPRELKDYVDEIASHSSQKSDSEAIRERLRDVLPLLKISKYRKSLTGSQIAAESDNVDLVGGMAFPRPRSGPRRNRMPVEPPSTVDALLHILSKDKGVQSQEIEWASLPKVQWVSTKDGTRDPEEYEDRAAHFLEKDNLIIANRDFQGFTDLIQFVCAKLSAGEEQETLVVKSCYSYFEQQLMEVVLGVQSLRKRPEWSPSDIDSANSDEALTASIMGRSHILQAVLREVKRAM